jgi:Thioredoxin
MKLILILGFIAIALSQQIPSIPSAPDGFVLGNLDANANYTVDVFFDHLCPYSAQAFKPLYTYWALNQLWLRVVIHIVPLPYHYYAFWVGTAGRYIQLNYPSNFTDFLNYFFKVQDTYTVTAQSWNQTTLFNSIASDTYNATNVDPSEILSALNNNTYDYSLRSSWKYAMSKGIIGTPLYMVNQVLLNDADFESYSDWENFFNSLN